MATRGGTRREHLKHGITGLAAGTAVPGLNAEAAATDTQAKPKVRYSELLPHEFRARLTEKPLAYLPLGTLEWHGEHLPYGSDAIQSEELMIECARRYGGIVLPPIHVGPGPTRRMDDGRILIGMDFWNNVVDPPRQLDGDCYWIPEGLFSSLVDGIVEQCRRTGFRAVFADGHGPSRASWVRDMKRRQDYYGLKLFGVAGTVREDWRSQTDHAALNETSLMMHYRSDLVDMGRLSGDRADWPLGVSGDDPRDATADHGMACMEACLASMIRAFREAGV